MKRAISSLASVVAVGILGLSGIAQGAFLSGLINVDFNTNQNGTPLLATGSAVIGAPGDLWNDIDVKTANFVASNIALTNSGGQSTDALLSYSGKGGYNGRASSTNVNDALLNEWLSVTGANHGTVSIAGLDSQTTYELYVYSQADQPLRAARFTVTGASQLAPETIDNSLVKPVSPSTKFGDNGYVSGGNYLLFTLQPSAAGVISIDFVKAGTDPQNEGDINGFQLKAVPEPASLSLLGLGALALLRRRRTT